MDILEYNAKKLEEPAQEEFFFVPDLSHSVRMFPALVDKIGLLGDTTLIMNVTQAYIVIDQYCENLLMIGGRMGEGIPEHRRLILVPSNRAKTVVKMNTQIAERVSNAMVSLDKYLD